MYLFTSVTQRKFFFRATATIKQPINIIYIPKYENRVPSVPRGVREESQ